MAPGNGGRLSSDTNWFMNNCQTPSPSHILTLRSRLAFGDPVARIELAILGKRSSLENSAFNESDHPRGQPDNAGQFVAKDEGSATFSGEEWKKEKRRLLSGPPDIISVKAAERLLENDITVKRDEGGRPVIFSKDKLVSGHVRVDHKKRDYDGRMQRLLYAIDAARTAPAEKEPGVSDRIRYQKDYKEFAVRVLADMDGHVQQVFTFYPIRHKKSAPSG